MARARHAGETALITGATGGIGSELACCFARDGYALVLVGHDAGRLDALARDLAERFGTEAQTIVADLAQPDAAARIVEQTRERGIRVDALVNDAGFGYDAPFAASDAARQDALVAVNVTALTQLCHAYAPAMQQRQHGAILNVASVAGFLAGPGMATYYASKAYVQSLTQALHIELLGSGVHVSALCPAPVRTPFWENADAAHTALAHIAVPAPLVARAGYAALRLNKTLCTPGILARLIVFATRLLPRSWIARIAGLLQYHRPHVSQRTTSGDEEA